MTREEIWLPTVRRYADDLGLKDWRFSIVDTDPDADDVHACIRCIYGRKVAVITISTEFVTDSPENQRDTLCHELLHCHLDGVDTVINAINGQMHRDVWDVTYAAFRSAMEFGVDGIALAIAHHLPLPEPTTEET